MIYAFLSQKGAKLGSGTFKGKLLNIFGGTRKVIGFICTILGPGVDPLGHPWPKQTDQPSARQGYGRQFFVLWYLIDVFPAMVKLLISK